MHLLSLPTEIITQIFLNLTWRDILKLKCICKTIYEFSQSTTLQYHLLLGIAGYDDGPSKHPMSKSQRLNLLRRLESSFNYGNFSRMTRIPLGGSYTPTYDLRGGILLQGRYAPGGLHTTGGVNVFRLPSAITDRGSIVSWKLPDLLKPIRDLNVDSSQDLLVLVGGGSLGSTAIETTFVSLTTGDPHPLSSGSYVIPIPMHSDVSGFTIVIMGSSMGLLVAGLRFVIYNWKKGKVEVDIPFDDSDPINSFFFLDHSRFGLIRGRRRPANIEIHRFKPNEGASSGSALTAVYHLLSVDDDVTIGRITCRSGSSPGLNDTSMPYMENRVFSTPPFIPRLDDGIIVMGMTFFRGTPVANCVMVVRAETLMNIPEGSECIDGVYVVTANLWMDKTHVQPRTLGNWDCFVYGSRFVTLSYKERVPESWEEDEGSWLVQITVFDMNPRLVAWAKSEGCKTIPYGIECNEPIDREICDSSDLASSEVLDEPWSGGLSAITTRFIADGVLARTNNEFVVMIDGDRLALIKLRISDDRTRLLYLHMNVYYP